MHTLSFKSLGIDSFFFKEIKWIVHPKMKILSTFTCLQVVSNLYFFFFLLDTNKDILKNMGN